MLGKMALEDLTRYQAGELAKRFYESRDSRNYVGGALYQLASDMGVEEEADGFIKGSMASRQGMETAAKVYSEKYHEAFKDVSMGDLKGHYENYITEYGDEDAAKVTAEFDKFSSETHGDITKKLARAEYVLKGEALGEYTENDRTAAKETLEKYGRISLIMKQLEDIKFENIRGDAVKISQEESSRELIEKLGL